MPVASAAGNFPPSIRPPYLNRIMGSSPGPFNITPDIAIRPAVSPSREVVLCLRISALKFERTNELFVLPKRSATIVPTNVIAVRMLVPPRLPITPDRSLRLRGVLFCDEDVGTFVGEDVFPSTPDTSMLIIRPYKLPSVILSPRTGWPVW